jgi:uncharacterized protein
MDFIAFPFELKQLGATGQIEGLAAGYGDVDLQGEVLQPGAFARSLATGKQAGRMPAMLLHHDLARPVGRWDTFTESSDGLVAKGRLTLDVNDGREAYALLRDGALTGLSVGFTGAKAAPGRGPRTITEAELIEVSLVTIPANPRARVSSVKAIGGARDIEELLRESGVSGRKAKAAASAAWRAINDNDSDPAADAAVAAILTKATADLSRFKKG